MGVLNLELSASAVEVPSGPVGIEDLDDVVLAIFALVREARLSSRAQKLAAQMGAIGTEIWGLAAEAYAAGHGSVADALRGRDDEIDDLHMSLTAELAAGRVSVPVAIEMALAPSRYFERLGADAVNVSCRVQAMNADLARSA